METSYELTGIRQKSHRLIQQDGITELMAGWFFFLYSAICDSLISGVRRVSVILLICFLVIFAGILRNRITYPRIGYAKFKESLSPLYITIVFIPLILIAFAITIITRFFADSIGFEPWLRWVPAWFGVTIALFYNTLRRNSGQNYYLVFEGLSVVLGIALTFISFQDPQTGFLVFFGAIGIATALVGFFKLLRFLKTHPQLNDEGSNERS